MPVHNMKSGISGKSIPPAYPLPDWIPKKRRQSAGSGPRMRKPLISDIMQTEATIRYAMKDMITRGQTRLALPAPMNAVLLFQRIFCLQMLSWRNLPSWSTSLRFMWEPLSFTMI